MFVNRYCKIHTLFDRICSLYSHASNFHEDTAFMAIQPKMKENGDDIKSKIIFVFDKLPFIFEMYIVWIFH